MAQVAALSLLLLPALAGGQATLSNAHIAVAWTRSCGISFLGRPSSTGGPGNNTIDPAAAALTWSIQAVGSNITGAVSLTSTSATCHGVRRDGARVVASYEAAVPGTGAVLGVTVATQLLEDTSPTHAGLISSKLSVTLLQGDAGTIGLWLAGLSIEGVRTTPAARAFLPRGLGVTEWANKTADSLNYPDMSGDVGATMQFIAVDVPATGSSFYMGTHDGAAHAKTLGMPSPAAVAGTTSGTLSLGFELTPEGAADPALLAGNRTYTVPFPFVVGVTPLDGTDASWYSASQVYRSWALTGAHWTKPGPISHRTRPAVAEWLLHTDVWVNGGRACFGKPALNATQGDPAGILAAVSQIAARFALPSLGFHWYKWECGPASNDDCANPADPARFKFDTHYPDYFPARRATLMAQVVEELRTKHNVHTVPYTNGRLFDIAAQSYTHPAGTGNGVCCAAPTEPALGPFKQGQLEYATEVYEQPGVFFHIADPTDTWWQNKYRDVVDRLVNGLGVDGVYIDQLAAAGPMLDFTPGRSHGTGGGSWWSSGIAGMLGAVRTKTPNAPVFVEGNAEDKIGVVQGMLVPSSLGYAFARNVSAPADSSRRSRTGVLTPAFVAVYGGYNIFFGDIYTAADLAHPDILCAKLAGTFCAGTQVGWFDVGGVVGTPDFDQSCGETGQLGLWMDPKHDPEVAFLRKIAATRALVRDFVTFGRLGHPPTRVGKPVPIFSAPVVAVGEPEFSNRGPFPKLSTAVWIAANGTSAILLLAAPTHVAMAAHYDLDPARWYLDCPQEDGGGGYGVSVLRADGQHGMMGRHIAGAVVKVRLTVPGRDVIAVHLECTAPLRRKLQANRKTTD